MEENNKKKEVIIRKIALQNFIEKLVSVYNSGADYVDIIGTPDENQDTIGIVVHEEYLSKDELEIEFITDDEEEEEYIEPTNDKPLSDEDINDLI
jgi:nitrogen regulatory protein PII